MQEDEAVLALAAAEVAATIVQDGFGESAHRLGKHHPQRTCESLARQVCCWPV